MVSAARLKEPRLQANYRKNIIQYIADILFYEKEEGFEFETSVREAINNIKAEFTKNNILDNHNQI